MDEISVTYGRCGLYTLYTCNSKLFQSLGCGLCMVAAYTKGFTEIFHH